MTEKDIDDYCIFDQFIYRDEVVKAEEGSESDGVQSSESVAPDRV